MSDVKSNILFWPPALRLKEFKCDFSGGHLIYALLGRGGMLGRLNGPLPFFSLILKNRCLQEQYALRRKEHAYMSCTYTKTSLTRNETSVFFLVCLGLQVWLKGWLMSVYALIVKQNDWSAAMCCCTDVMKWMIYLIFTSEIQNHCPQTGQCDLLMYNNELCSMVVFWSWFIIGLNCISHIRNRQCPPQSDVCFCLKPRSTLGVLAGLIGTVNLLAWSKVFHVKFLSHWTERSDSDHCHVDNQSGSLFTCLFGCWVSVFWERLGWDLTVKCAWGFRWGLAFLHHHRISRLSLYLWIVLNNGIVSKIGGVLLAKDDSYIIFGSQDVGLMKIGTFSRAMCQLPTVIEC